MLITILTIIKDVALAIMICIIMADIKHENKNKLMKALFVAILFSL